VNQRKEKAIEK